MKANNIYICHNLLSVYKSITFHNLHYSNSTFKIVYMNTTVNLPLNIVENLKLKIDLEICDFKSYKCGKLSNFIEILNYAKELIRTINHNINKEVDNRIYLFLDHTGVSPTIIKYYAKYKGDFIKEIGLMDEGLGLYSLITDEKGLKTSIKKLIFRLFGLSTYGISQRNPAMNPLIDHIYCMEPEKLKLIKPSVESKIFFEGDLFSEDYIMDFVKMIDSQLLNKLNNLSKYDIVFLTQPVSNLMDADSFENLIIEILNLLDNKEILIKKHPRDNFDYRKFCKENIAIFDENLSVLPFEVIYPFFYKSTLITFSSSCCNNIMPNNKSIFLYRLLENHDFTEFNDNIGYDENKIVVINNLQELYDIMK